MPSIREQFADDRHRPVYHFVPPKNWTNDPTGTFQDGGLFHLFYQYRDAPSPEGPGGWGTWCHAATEDFIHWVDYPVALEREEGGPDRVGCWSGGAFERDGSHTLIYWGNPGGICLATSDDGYRTWRKHPRNPVIELPEEPVEWRLHDPCAWRDGEWFYMASGSQMGKSRAIGTSRDAGFLFRSRDAVDWEYAGLLYEPGGESDLAVPSFFPFGDEHMLLFASHSRGAQYYLGPYAGGRFERRVHGRFNYTSWDPGPAMHVCGDSIAPSSWLAPDGRRIVITWIAEGRTPEAMARAGWAGIMSLPWEMRPGRDGTVRVAPVRELEGLRGMYRSLEGAFADDGEQILPGIAGDTIELRAEIDPGSADETGLKLRCDLDGQEETVVTWDRGFVADTAGRVPFQRRPGVRRPRPAGRRPRSRPGAAAAAADLPRPLGGRGLRRGPRAADQADLPAAGRQHRNPLLRPGRAGEPAVARLLAAQALPLLQPRSLAWPQGLPNFSHQIAHDASRLTLRPVGVWEI